jgi:hypothetical protein
MVNVDVLYVVMVLMEMVMRAFLVSCLCVGSRDVGGRCTHYRLEIHLASSHRPKVQVCARIEHATRRGMAVGRAHVDAG